MSDKDYNIIKRYNIETFKKISIVAPLLTLCSAVILTTLKILGYFPETSVAGTILFDVMCIIYLASSIVIRRIGIARKDITEKVITMAKYIIVVISILHWNMIAYLFPYDSFWAYEPLFVLVAASFFDSGLVLIDVAGLGLSIIIAGILGKGGFIPVVNDFYSAEVFLRWTALILTNVVIYSLTKYTGRLVNQVSAQFENFEMFRKSGAIELVKSKSSGSDGKMLLNGIVVLLVDDNELTRDINGDILRSEGATVIEAESGESAILKFKDNLSFDVVIMDLIMPGMGGIEAIKRIRTLELGKPSSVPIIAISGEASEEEMRRAISAGADEALSKPLDVKRFSGAFIAALKARSSLTQLQLREAQKAMAIDALTHVKSIAAYTDKVTEISGNMDALYPNGFAVVMCDINGLKKVNDSFGHDSGDIYIKNNCHIICDVFNHSPVYRIGGDEFVVILEGISYINRKQLFNELLVRVDKAEKIPSINEGKASFAAGMSAYRPGKDMNFGDVLKRADVEMYARKKNMKAANGRE